MKIRAETLARVVAVMSRLADQLQSHHNRIRVRVTESQLQIQLLSAAAIVRYTVSHEGATPFEAIYPVTTLASLSRLTDAHQEMVTLGVKDLKFPGATYSMPAFKMKYPEKSLCDFLESATPFQTDLITDVKSIADLLPFAGKTHGYMGVVIFCDATAIASDSRTLAVVRQHTGNVVAEPVMYGTEVIKTMAMVGGTETVEVDYLRAADTVIQHFHAADMEFWFPLRQKLAIQNTPADERRQIFDHPLRLCLAYDSTATALTRLLVTADKSMDHQVHLVVKPEGVTLEHRSQKSFASEQLHASGDLEALAGFDRAIPGVYLKRAMGALKKGSGDLVLRLKDPGHVIHATRIHRDDEDFYFVMGFRR